MPFSFDNGLACELKDESVRYYGDYHHVRLVLRFTFPCDERSLPTGEFLDEVRSLLGERITFDRVLSRMAVPTADLEQTKRDLLESFRKSALPYLSRPEFPKKRVKHLLAELRRQGGGW